MERLHSHQLETSGDCFEVEGGTDIDNYMSLAFLLGAADSRSIAVVKLDQS